MSEQRAIYLLSPTHRSGTIPMPMIHFSTVADRLELEGCDTLMFTSKQAVVTADRIDTGWKEYPSIAIGAATKKQIEDLGGKVIYYPQSYYGETLSRDIITRFSGRKILYLRPKEVSFDSKSFLKKAGIDLQEQVIYETGCISYNEAEKPVRNAIIIFTSPSTIHCFLKSFNWDESYIAVVIGRATKVHLPENATYAVAEEPLISSCIKKAKFLQENTF
ncbi:uroporphyrinogen-III synthase [Sulfurovum lithotrophicum]|uniref:Uroporphyrinogen-III synthase n=1 Tax=Sulfurovum lithotrophicum TaxID=206403 RepID=A0A7U4M042_9BACT|nr:uroporphyrinogen-III synthase [Sulfurovum lithotrophicum]AKF24413.1 uroporphyrinogen-III synthase [Sulfurovum lithotrophicum]